MDESLPSKSPAGQSTASCTLLEYLSRVYRERLSAATVPCNLVSPGGGPVEGYGTDCYVTFNRQLDQNKEIIVPVETTDGNRMFDAQRRVIGLNRAPHSRWR